MSRRKVIKNILIFSALILLNVFIVFKYIARQHRITAMNQILDEIATSSLSQGTISDIATASDSAEFSNIRAANLKSFFRKYSSPLYDHAELIVKTSDDNGLDYRLIPAIAMQESTLCKFIPPNSHNCWGWGIYGNKVTRFASYEEAIQTVAAGLKRNYIDKGRTTPSEIMAAYTPSSNGSWANGVNTVLRLLE